MCFVVGDSEAIFVYNKSLRKWTKIYPFHILFFYDQKYIIKHLNTPFFFVTEFISTGMFTFAGIIIGAPVGIRSLNIF